MLWRFLVNKFERSLRFAHTTTKICQKYKNNRNYNEKNQKGWKIQKYMQIKYEINVDTTFHQFSSKNKYIYN